MEHPRPSDVSAKHWLGIVGIETLDQWDVLAFLFQKSSSLVSTEQIATITGHSIGQVVATVDLLEARKFLMRSRVNQGVRLYELTKPSDPIRGEPLRYLRALAEDRKGRMVIAKILQSPTSIDARAQ